jgi:UDP-glucose 4-epimerase
MTTVAVTGTSGAVGQALLERLDTDPAIERIIGLDGTEPQMPVAKLEFRTADVRDPVLSHALRDAEVVVHLAFTPAPVADEDTMFALNVHGTRNVLDAARKTGARKVVHLSSATVYGAHPDNPIPLDEQSALRANPDFNWAYHKLLAEEMVADWADQHPDAVVTVLRPAPILGPAVDDYIARHFESPRLPLVRGHEPPVHFVHVDDVAAALHLAVTADLPGAYNVGADGWLPAGQVCAILARKPLVLPEVVAFPAAERMWRWGLVAAPSGALHYLMHPWVVSSERLKAQGWAATRSNRDILREHAAEHRGYWSLGRVRLRRRHVHAGGLAAAAAFGLIVLRLVRKRSRARTGRRAGR